MSQVLEQIGVMMKFTTEQVAKNTGSPRLEVGDTAITVFHNGVLILSMREDRDLLTKVILTTPFHMDYTLGDSGEILNYTMEQLIQDIGTSQLQPGEEAVTIFHNGALLYFADNDGVMKSNIFIATPFVMDYHFEL